MKIAVAAVAALAAGVLGGSVVGGVRAKVGVLEAIADSVEAIADSVAASAPADDHRPEAATAHNEPVVDADPAAADTSGVDTHEATPSQADSSQGDGSETPASEGGVSADVGSSGAAGVDTPAVRQGRSAADSAAAREEGARKLSKIFGAMKAADAAAVLSELTDGEIEVILRYMSERLAAPILEAFEPARAAALSRIVLQSGGDGP